MSEYYILNIGMSEDCEDLIWWGPERTGYTRFLDRAGVFTEETVKAKRGFYDDGFIAKAIPVDIVHKFTRTVCPTKLLAVDVLAERLAP